MKSRSSAFKENRGSDKVIKVNPRIIGKLTERNEIHEICPCHY